MSKPYLLFAVFVSGMVVLAVEVSASRLLGPVFGDSHLVWASIIGLMLLYLAAGYFIGGRWADASPHPRAFFWILAWGAFGSALAPLLARPVLHWAAGVVSVLQAGVTGGAFIAVLVLFAGPVTLLGCASPFAIRLALAEARGVGQVAGQIYAVSTLGSLLGSFLPVLWLIPTLGTTLNFLAFAGALWLVAVGGLWQVSRAEALRALWMPLVIGIGYAISPTVIKPTAGLLYERESAYNYIQVVEQPDGARWLLLNEGQGVHSIYHPTGLATFGTWDFFLAAPFFMPEFRPPQRVAVVGLAAGTAPRQYTAVFGPIAIDGIEIDPAIVEVGRRYFAMTEPNLNVIVGDGRWALGQQAPGYDVIVVDAYRLPYIPWQLTTREFFALAHSRLTDAGVLAINVGRTPNDRRLVEALTATLLAVFPSVHVADVPNTLNTIVYATVQPTQASALQRHAAGLPVTAHPLLRSTLPVVAAALRPPVAGPLIFTDERAPLEQLTNAIVLDYMLGLR